MMWESGTGYGGMMGFGGIFALLFWVLLIVAVVAAARWLFSLSGDKALPESPLEILNRRYAAGEIDDEEYQKRKKAITGSGSD